MNIKIATILTCFNRREKTVKCLKSLFHVAGIYNAKHPERQISLTVYLTDDGCTDGTAKAVLDNLTGREVHILQGTGSLYWAGGMILAWKEALKRRKEWDFYLLLNDDTFVMDNVFDELFAAHDYAVSVYGKAGIYSGVTCNPDDNSIITYGGGIYENASRSKIREVMPSGKPQMVDRTNANILLVSRSVVEEVGIFYGGYKHGGPDYDYCIMVRNAGLPALITGHACGMCDFDHTSDADVCRKLMKMSLKERVRYAAHPIRGDHDYLLFVRRHNPEKYPITWFLRKLRVYMPSAYMLVNKMRGKY